jgi:hypothetical protein
MQVGLDQVRLKVGDTDVPLRSTPLAARVTVLVAQPLEDSFGGVRCFLPSALSSSRIWLMAPTHTSSFGRRAGCCRR